MHVLLSTIAFFSVSVKMVITRGTNKCRILHLFQARSLARSGPLMKTSELLHFAFRAGDPLEHIDAALAQVQTAFQQLARNLDPAGGIPLLLFETAMQGQQQQ